MPPETSEVSPVHLQQPVVGPMIRLAVTLSKIAKKRVARTETADARDRDEDGSN